MKRRESRGAKIMSQPLLQVQGIDKFFGAVEAVRDVSFDVGSGEILGLIGDNGAGKSTLIKVISGVHEPSAGQIFWKDRPLRISSPKFARSLGIETIYQDLALAENYPLQPTFSWEKRLPAAF